MFLAFFFIRNEVPIGVWVYVWVFNFTPLICVSLIVPVLYYYYHYISKVDGETFTTSFIIQDCFIYSGFYVLPYKVEICPFKVCEELGLDFDGD